MKSFFFHYYYLFYGQVRLFDSVCCWCRCESSRLESERERENAERNLCCDVNCASLNIGRMGQSDSVKHLSPLSIVFMTFGLAVATPSVPFPLNSPFKIFAIIKDKKKILQIQTKRNRPKLSVLLIFLSCFIFPIDRQLLKKKKQMVVQLRLLVFS